jgi:hypothetical protein
MGILNARSLTQYAGQVILLSQGAGRINKVRIPSVEAEAMLPHLVGELLLDI